MDCIDFFCGIGGLAEAVRDSGAAIVAAYDIDQTAASVYQINHGVEVDCRTLESITAVPPVDCWWLSPPCQPYTRRGHGRAEDDPRSAALAHLIMLIDNLTPKYLAMENVPAFADSAHHQQLTDVLDRRGYQIESAVLCPTQWGVPMRRKRFYLRASRGGRSMTPVQPTGQPVSLVAFLDHDAWQDDTLRLDESLQQRYRRALDIVDVDDQHAVTACFTSAYGKSPVRSGSYLRCHRRGIVRRFSPTEIARLMGFHHLRWRSTTDDRTKYRLLGNSLPVPVVRSWLRF